MPRIHSPFTVHHLPFISHLYITNAAEFSNCKLLIVNLLKIENCELKIGGIYER